MHAPAPSVDPTGCDREPIHIPGAIQPHGLLLVADAAGIVVAGAGDIEERLAAEWLGRPLDTLLEQDVGALLAADGDARTASGAIARGPHERFSVVFHRTAERLLVELEPIEGDPASAGAVLGWLDAAASGFERASDLQRLCERAAIAFRNLTGFDRVMVYRFLDDEAGRVIAEDRAPHLHGFLHHHFPASDIPAQARALYVRNRTRAIPDIRYTPAPIRPEGFAGIDLSDVSLRSVSPIHIEYLDNMGVEASASISIVKDGLLWGLIACHHYKPRMLPFDVRTTAATLASGLARQIRAKEEAETYRERLRLHAAEAVLTPRLGEDDGVRQIVAGSSEDLRQMFAADGIAFVQGRTVDCYGVTPDEADVADIARWARGRSAEPFATHALSTVLPAAAAWHTHASGLLAVPLADDGATLLWFRAELVEEVEWAGNPHKAVTLAPGETLSPRASFESWTQTVRGCSRRWTLEEVAAAHRLRRAFAEAFKNHRLLVLNRDLQRALADKDGLIAQKDVLMKEVNHRVQNSLQLVSAFLRLQAKAANDPALTEHLAEAQARISAVALVHRRLYRDDQVENVDLGRYLEELIGDMKASLGAEWAAQIRLDLAPVLMPTDRAVNIGLILTELVINATKYAYPAGATGPISIALEQHRMRLRLIVADEGRGKTGNGQGFGSRMMDAMVERLSGEIDFADNSPGLRVILTAPIEEVER